MGRRTIIGTRLDQALERSGISSQEMVGILAGLNVSGASTRMNNYFTGTNEPKLSTMTRIAAVLDTPVPYFYCTDNTLADLILKCGKLSEAQKSRLLALANEPNKLSEL
jgi:hypothetical protein